MPFFTSDHLQLAVAILSTAVGLYCCAQVYRNDNRRALRSQFRNLLEEHRKSTAGDFVLAQRIGEALKAQDPRRLEQITLAPFLQDYIVDDFEFRPKLYKSLSQYATENRLHPSQEGVEKILNAITQWKKSKAAFEKATMAYLHQISSSGHEAREIQKFVESKGGDYFEVKTDEFVEDVKDVVTSVVREKTVA